MSRKNSLWSMKLSTAAIVLIPVAVAINFVGKFLASQLRLPLWLDSIGTVLSALLGGPVVGAIVGLINNIIVAFTLDPMAWPYALTQIGLGLVVGILAKSGFIKNLGRAIVASLAAGAVAVVISTPLNIIIWQGYTGNVWGDRLFEVLLHNHTPLWLASLINEVVIDMPDKIVVVIIAYLIFKGLPKTLISMYDNDEVQTFDESKVK